jgi:hypothetical protein
VNIFFDTYSLFKLYHKENGTDIALTGDNALQIIFADEGFNSDF